MSSNLSLPQNLKSDSSGWPSGHSHPLLVWPVKRFLTVGWKVCCLGISLGSSFEASNFNVGTIGDLAFFLSGLIAVLLIGEGLLSNPILCAFPTTAFFVKPSNFPIWAVGKPWSHNSFNLATLLSFHDVISPF